MRSADARSGDPRHRPAGLATAPPTSSPGTTATPTCPRTWPLDAAQVAVIGVGNVALDVARILAKHADDLLPTEIPANVYEGLASNPVTDVHVFARRGPAQAKFTPLELRELGHVPDVDVVVYPEDFDVRRGLAGRHRLVQPDQAGRSRPSPTGRCASADGAAPRRRVHLHFLAAGRSRVLGDGPGRRGLRTERTALDGDGTVSGTGEIHDWPVQAVYRAVGYFGSPLPGPARSTTSRACIPNARGASSTRRRARLPGVYATGWIKRGPVGSDRAHQVRRAPRPSGTSWTTRRGWRVARRARPATPSSRLPRGRGARSGRVGRVAAARRPRAGARGEPRGASGSRWCRATRCSPSRAGTPDRGLPARNDHQPLDVRPLGAASH